MADELRTQRHRRYQDPRRDGGDPLTVWAERTGRRRVAGHERGGLRGPAGPAARRYLLAGLLRCGVCGGGWNPRGPTASPATGAGTATPAPPAPTLPGNLYLREDTILPRLAALAILQQDSGHQPRSRKRVSRQITAPAQAADQIEQLRASGVSVIYDPATKTLRTDGVNAVPVTAC